MKVERVVADILVKKQLVAKDEIAEYHEGD